MIKLTNPTLLKKLAKGALAVVLAGSFTFAGTSAFADSNDQTTDQTATTQQATTTDTASVSTQTQETPSLVPGDFFYFAKVLFEKIQLALTFDQTKEAKLLAANASERLAEAQALFASGDQQKAVDTLQAALDDMNSAAKIVDKDDDQATESDSTKTETVATDDTADSSKAEAEDTKDATKVEDTKDATKTEDTKDSTKAEDTKDSAELKDIKEQLAKSIKALQAALEKGHKSEAAKKALNKNIAKLIAKLGLENSTSTEADGSTTASTDATPTTDATAATDTTATTDATTATDVTATTDTTATTDPTTSGTTDATTVTDATATTSTDAPATAAPVSEPTKPVNHGQIVSQVAKQATPGQNHGQVVSKVAKQLQQNTNGKAEKGQH